MFFQPLTISLWWKEEDQNIPTTKSDISAPVQQISSSAQCAWSRQFLLYLVNQGQNSDQFRTHYCCVWINCTSLSHPVSIHSFIHSSICSVDTRELQAMFLALEHSLWWPAEHPHAQASAWGGKGRRDGELGPDSALIFRYLHARNDWVGGACYLRNSKAKRQWPGVSQSTSDMCVGIVCAGKRLVMGHGNKLWWWFPSRIVLQLTVIVLQLTVISFCKTYSWVKRS